MECLPNELYRRWETVRSEAASGAWGLWDLKSGSRWTFGEIQAEVDARPPLKRGSLCCPSGFSVELIFETLRAWRDGAVLCPVERDGDAPGEEAIAGLAPEICHLKLTSGTSSGPRMVAFDPGPLAADARKIVSTMGLRREWPNLGIISMSHSYGFSNLVLPLVLHGIPLAWLGDPLPGAVANVLENKELRLDGWTLPAVPAMWRVWHESGVIPPGAIRLAITAGAPMPVELERDLFASTGL
ncbi:MAG: hypothetical protein KDL87_07755, partial [Verrucomicrobiae bacterium]|nr:hypothetical protein [Verrucomicrobiae bacterium]